MTDTPRRERSAERQIPGLSPALRRRLRCLFRLLGAVSVTLGASVAARLFLTPLARRITPEDARFLRPARRAPVTAGGSDVVVYEWPGAGATVLLIHGWISHAARLRPVIEALQARELRVIAFDAPAHGASAGRQSDLYQFRAALAAVHAAYGPAQALLAHSVGAIAALSWLAADPAAATLRAAVLVAPPSQVEYLLESFSLAMGLSAAVQARLQQRFAAYRDEFDVTAAALKLRLPVLLVQGDSDELVPPAHAQQLAQHLRNGHLQRYPGLKHSEPLRTPVAVNAMVDFLCEQLRAGH